MSGGFIFDDGVVKVGNGILWIAGTTYPLRAINSLRAVVTDNRYARWSGVVVALFGFGLLATGEWDLVPWAIVAMIGGAAVYILVKDKYKLMIITIGGEFQAMVSDDEQYIKAVRGHIEECIASQSVVKTSD